MLLYYQWATNTVRDWGTIDLWSGNPTAWSALPKKARPTGPVSLNNAAGWLNSLLIQGMGIDGYDHYRVTLADAADPGVVVLAWSDDPATTPPDRFSARQLHFRPLAPDPAFGGAINTNISQRLWAAPALHAEIAALGRMEKTTLHLWSEFAIPADDATVRHGVQVDSTKFAQLQAIQTKHMWDEWGAPTNNRI